MASRFKNYRVAPNVLDKTGTLTEGRQRVSTLGARRWIAVGCLD